MAVTEQGVAMLSSVLRSKRAIRVNIEIMRAFVELRRMLGSNADLARKLETLEQKYTHEVVDHAVQYVRGNVHTNSLENFWSLLKRGIVGTWHKVSAKHLPAYLDEMCFRFNNRKNQFLFRDTLIKLILSPNLEYKDLTAKVQDAAA